MVETGTSYDDDYCELTHYYDGTYFGYMEHRIDIEHTRHSLETIEKLNKFVQNLTSDVLTDKLSMEDKEKLIYALQNLYPDTPLTKAAK